MTTTETPTYRPVLPIFVGDRELPAGCDTWGIRSVHADFASSHGFRWPFPGQWATAPGPIDETNTDGCPADKGDGICVADTMAGMASGRIPARTVLLVAYAAADVLGMTQGGGKSRVRQAFVVDVIDGEATARADLSGADLTGAYLTRAYLTRAYLSGADLTYANLTGADLTGADLTYAYLTGADLTRADLTRAYLTRAYLSGADLTYADLTGADLTYANLTYANLTGADLTGADLTGADLAGALARYTVWPTGFDHAAAGVVTA